MVAVNFNEKELIDKKDDPLWFEWLLACGIFRYKIVRLIFKFNVIFTILKYCVQIYIFKDNMLYFVRYGLLFFGEPLAVAMGIAILWEIDYILDMFVSFPLWKLDSCGEECRRKLERDMRIHVIAIAATLCSSILASCAVMYPTASDRDYLFPVVLIEQYCPERTQWLWTLAYKLTLVPLGYSAMAFPLVVMYGAQHTMAQAEMLGECFKGILTGSEDMDEDLLFCDKQFQDEVNDRIMYCVKRQIEMIELGLRGNKLVQEVFGAIFVFGYFVGIGVAMFYISCKLGYFEYTLANMLFPINMSINAAALFVGTIICGQQTEESMELLTSAVNEWKWWAMDLRNQNLMLMILTGTKDFKLKFSQTVVLNYDLGVKTFKTIYSLTSLLATVEKFQ